MQNLQGQSSKTDLKVNTIYSRKPGEMLPWSGFNNTKVTDIETMWEEFLIKWFDKTWEREKRIISNLVYFLYNERL